VAARGWPPCSPGRYAGRTRGIAMKSPRSPAPRPPDGAEQMISADDLAAMQRQDGRHRPAPQATQPPWLTVDYDVKRAGKAHLHDAPGLFTVADPWTIAGRRTREPAGRGTRCQPDGTRLARLSCQGRRRQRIAGRQEPGRLISG
jgi:hypothetical protein